MRGYNSQYFFRSFFRRWLLAAGPEGGPAGGGAGTLDRGVAGVAGARRSSSWPVSSAALLAPPRCPSHELISAGDPHLPAPRLEVSKVNEKFHP